MTAAFGDVWVSNYFDTSVSRIDPARGKVISTIEVELGGQVMAVVGGCLWISAVDTNVVQCIDPSTERVETFDEIGDYPDGLLALDGLLWIASDLGPELRRLDPASGEVTGPWIVGEQGVLNANQLVVEEGDALWMPLFDSAEVVQLAIPG